MRRKKGLIILFSFALGFLVFLYKVLPIVKTKNRVVFGA